MRQAFAGMLWSQAVLLLRRGALAGRRPGAAGPAAGARAQQRNARWRNFNAFDIMSMPDKWEYPWFAAWDLAFHCVSLAHVDPAFAKYQLVLLCREWFQHPNGALPAYEWDFGDVNPPVQAWAALEVFALDGGNGPRLPRPDLRQAAGQLHLVGEPGGRTGATTCSRAASSAWTTSGRSTGRTCRRARSSSSPTRPAGWPSTRCRWPRSRSILWRNGRQAGADLVLKFLEHYAGIAQAMTDQGMWDAEDGMFYDHLCLPSGAPDPGQGQVDGRHDPAARGRHRGAAGGRQRAAVRQAVRRLPGPAGAGRRRQAARAGHELRDGDGQSGDSCCSASSAWTGSSRCSGRCSTSRQFLSPYGLRSLSRGAQGPAVRAAPGGHHRDDRLRARRVDDRACSAATPTGAGRSGSR